MLFWLFGLAWCAYISWFVVAPRFLDIGMPRVCILLAFVPPVNIALGLMALFAPTGWWLPYRRAIAWLWTRMVK
ncbi:MAG: hypothetical protein DME19_12590 [Verrucomicrobia bacterium]|nr:MAG: hypothetical protein DME19_12590 [Verrucomicrobiota bacterium]